MTTTGQATTYDVAAAAVFPVKYTTVFWEVQAPAAPAKWAD